MNENIKAIIENEYRQYGLYDVKIKKTTTVGTNLCVYLDVIHKRNETNSHGYCKRIFYDYLSDEDIKESLFYYFYDTKRKNCEKNELMSEENIIVIGTIELKRYVKNGHLTRWCPLLLDSKSKFSTNFKKNVIKRINEFGVSKTYKELCSIKGLKISRASIYNLAKSK